MMILDGKSNIFHTLYTFHTLVVGFKNFPSTFQKHDFTLLRSQNGLRCGRITQVGILVVHPSDVTQPDLCRLSREEGTWQKWTKPPVARIILEGYVTSQLYRDIYNQPCIVWIPIKQSGFHGMSTGFWTLLTLANRISHCHPGHLVVKDEDDDFGAEKKRWENTHDRSLVAVLDIPWFCLFLENHFCTHFWFDYLGKLLVTMDIWPESGSQKGKSPHLG